MHLCQQVTDKEIWDGFVTSQPHHTFLHSWAWGEFNRELGDKIWRLGIYDEGELMSVALLIKVHARRGNFLFVPHGPIIKPSGSDPDGFGVRPEHIKKTFEVFLKRFKEVAKEEGANFLRISSLLEDSDLNRKLFKDLGFRPAPIHMHAETTWSLDLTQDESALFMNMRKTTRNLIRRSVKEGVIIKTGVAENDVEIFYNLYKETVMKHRFTPFSLSYLKNQVKIFSVGDGIRVFTAWYNNEPIASAIVVFYGASAFYHHGASSTKYPKIPAAYLLQWAAIKEAKRRGHKLYNFWGIVPKDNFKHPWAGITLFKKGFGGFQTDYIHAQDLPLSWKYWPNYILETTRRMRRRL